MSADYAHTRGRARIGVVVPVSNSNLEPDMTMMCPPGVSAHFARAGGYDVDAVPDETQMQRYSAASVDDVIDGLKACKPDVVLYGCTSATLAQGPAFDEEFRCKIEARAGVPAVTAASSLIEALRDLGALRLAFSSPYVASLNDHAIAFLEALGFCCVGRADTLSALGNDEVAALTPEDVMALAVKADRPEAEAIVLSCTDMRAAEAVVAIERRLAKPVVTSNQAMMHAALKRLGIPHRESAIGEHHLARAAAAAVSA